MNIEQIYTGCLSQGAYYIESKGEVAIIDPLREVQPYIEKATKNQAKIKYIFETHFHADFVSGHVTLAKETGAKIIYGPKANPNYDVLVAEDGQEFRLGDLTIKVLHTPGHTLESSTFLLRDKAGKDKAIFTGDTLFLGDVGRPDLAQKSDLSQEDLAGMLYESLRQKIMPLSDDLTVYPAHGAGSACGKKMMKETVDTLGNQKKMNYALREDMSKEEFIQEVTEGLLPPPSYFPANVKMNKEGYSDIQDVLLQGTKPLNAEDFEKTANEKGALVLDVRKPKDFIEKHIPRSIFIGIDGGFAPWVGALIKDVKQPILLVTPKGREEETVTRLSRVGFDHTLGYLEGGIEAWGKAGKPTDNLQSVPATTLKKEIDKGEKNIFDVRKEGEFTASHISDVHFTPLDALNDYLKDFPKKEPFYVHCAGGYRSVIAASILKSRGIHNVIDVAGGFKAIREAGITVSSSVL